MPKKSMMKKKEMKTDKEMLMPMMKDEKNSSEGKMKKARKPRSDKGKPRKKKETGAMY